MPGRVRNVLVKVFLATAVTAAMTLVGGTGAGASGTIDLTTKTGINNYLTSIGVDPASAVWQQSLLNYAGPSCPGVGWNCVGTNAPVVQFALPGGTNLFSCSGVDCLVVQTSTSSSQNSAECKRTGQDESQSCDITQENSKSTNNANIEQSIVETGGCEQTATEAASIDQTNESGKNHARIQQRITQSSKSGTCGTQDQEAHQGATVNQATTSGDNFSDIDQSQKQSEIASSGSSITQNQNTTAETPEPCQSISSELKNQCAEVTQNSSLLLGVGGDQDSTLAQGITESETASNTDSLTQAQGLPTGGQNGDKTQTSSGLSTSHADESMSQQMFASGVPALSITRSRHTGDPRCCQDQIGNPEDQAFITQTTNQPTTSPPGSDETDTAALVGQCESEGECHLAQSATLNGNTTTNTCDSSFCEESIICGGEVGEGECAVFIPD